MYPRILEKIINFYKQLPSIGEKTAERLALATVDLDEDIIKEFSENLINSKEVLRPCSICNNISDQEVCPICSNENRNKNLICVIEDYKSVYTFEKAGNYKGTYHVLNGLISPINNIGPEDVNIYSLVKRVKNLDNPEIIIALKSSIEGETTTLYLKKIFEKTNVKVSRLSYGIPMGAEIDYLDILKLDKALEDRKIIS